MAFAAMETMGHEQVVFCADAEVGLRAIVAIHDTTLGPSLGGVRFRAYDSEEEALRDVLRLSRGMTYKNALAGLDLGGGKSVVLGGPEVKTEALLRAFGRFVHGLGGRYLVAEDMNATSADMDVIARETPYVTGRSPHCGGIGEPGPVTAWGAFHGIRAALRHATGSDDPSGRVVAIQGLGSVGGNLARILHDHGARLVVADVDAVRVRRAVDELGASAVSPDEILGVACDVLAPCAVGGVLNERTIPALRTGIVAGPANNVLEDEVADAERLEAAGVLVAPDYVVNAGGVIAMDAEWHGRSLEYAMARAERIHETTLAVFARAASDRVTTMVGSRRLAEERIRAVHHTRAVLAPRPLPPASIDPR